jgi:amino acid transporter
MALFGLFQCFNGNFAASTRMLFAFARRGTVTPRFAAIHPKFSTPSVAVIGITFGTSIGLLLGDAILVPVTEVGSMASALGWLAACLSFWLVEPRMGFRLITGLGICVSVLLLLMKLIPAFPGHFTHAEWIALATWLLLGAALHRRSRSASRTLAR